MITDIKEYILLRNIKDQLFQICKNLPNQHRLKKVSIRVGWAVREYASGQRLNVDINLFK